MNKTDLVVLLADHRQEHKPRDGSAVCSCGRWAGPYTKTVDERSFSTHLVEVISQAEDEDTDVEAQE